MNDWEALADLERASQAWASSIAHPRQLSRRYVPGEGPDDPLAFIVGEAPGALEDQKLRPFVGDSGLILRQLMALANLFTGFTPELGDGNAWLTNVVKFRPPGNRTPTPDEIEIARRYLRKEWLAVGAPDVVVAVGGTALTAVLGRKVSILARAGRPGVYPNKTGKPLFLWPMLHPAYVLHAKQNTEKLQVSVERDWEKLGRWLKRRE